MLDSSSFRVATETEITYCRLSFFLFFEVSIFQFLRGIMKTGCGNPNCKCGPDCTCTNCSCGRTMDVPSFGGLRNYNYEPDCQCGPDCKCADCDCHKGK